jgi:CRP/FNR family transcriptional regulator, cyclic AMP receptor protein
MQMMDLETIRAVEMFEGLKDAELGKIVKLSKQTDYPAQAVIVREGAPGGMLHIILEGKVEVRKRAVGGDEKPLAALAEGAVFGEMSLFDGYPFSATVLALQPTRTLSMFRNDFMALGESDPALAFKVSVNLLNILSRKLRKTNENLVSLAQLRGGHG